MVERGWDFAKKLYDEQRQYKIAYLAGFFDGEGCIQINKIDTKIRLRYYLRVSANQVNPKPIQMLYEEFGGHVSKRSGSRGVYQWITQGRKANVVLETLLPFLIVKSAQAELALEFQESLQYRRYYKPTEAELLRREAMKQEMHELKKEVYSWLLAE
jgi:hypothetical protein